MIHFDLNEEGSENFGYSKKTKSVKIVYPVQCIYNDLHLGTIFLGTRLVLQVFSNNLLPKTERKSHMKVVYHC